MPTFFLPQTLHSAQSLRESGFGVIIRKGCMRHFAPLRTITSGSLQTQAQVICWLQTIHLYKNFSASRRPRNLLLPKK